MCVCVCVHALACIFSFILLQSVRLCNNIWRSNYKKVDSSSYETRNVSIEINDILIMLNILKEHPLIHYWQVS